MTATLAQLLVHMDPSPQAECRLRLARTLAQAHGAAVHALYAVTPVLAELSILPQASPAMAQVLRDIDDERVGRARAAWSRAEALPGAHAAWAQVRGEPVSGVYAQQALYADLMVLGQYNPGAERPAHVPADFIETVLALSGKPALVIPWALEPAAVGEVVAIAWKSTPEAARAVAAALPILQRAKQVHILAWGEEDESVNGTALDLASYLRAYGVRATWHRQGSESPELGALLLSSVFDLGADLLVMGCYGHSRAREWALGGVSREVLQSMTPPVLMAR